MVTFTIYTNFDDYTEEWVAAIHRAEDGHHITNVRGDSAFDVLLEAAKVIDKLAAVPA